MTDDKKKRPRDLEDNKHLRAETYEFCSTHNRRYPQGGMCPNCAAALKKQKG